MLKAVYIHWAWIFDSSTNIAAFYEHKQGFVEKIYFCELKNLKLLKYI